MTLFPYKRRKIGERLIIRVSNHFCYSDFGVRDPDIPSHYGHRFVCSGTPGSGFFERESNSRSYHEFVRGHRSVRRPSYLDLLFNREPNYEHELKLAVAALHAESDPRKHELLECYVNALTIGRMEEEDQRLMRGVKEKMKRHRGRHLSSIVSHYKHKISQLERDMDSVEYHLKNHYSDEILSVYAEMVEAYGRMINRCRRVWHQNEKMSDNFAQVFFDLGVFDFIRSKTFLPLMRDSNGVNYYFLPDVVIVARSSVDFDLVPLKNLTMVYQETAIEETTELLSSRLGGAACMMLIPGLDLTFYFNHARVVIDFVRSVDKLKSVL